jgi:hypothetical protein
MDVKIWTNSIIKDGGNKLELFSQEPGKEVIAVLLNWYAGITDGQLSNFVNIDSPEQIIALRRRPNSVLFAIAARSSFRSSFLSERSERQRLTAGMYPQLQQPQQGIQRQAVRGFPSAVCMPIASGDSFWKSCSSRREQLLAMATAQGKRTGRHSEDRAVSNSDSSRTAYR